MAKKKEHVALVKCFLCNGDKELLLSTRFNSNGEPLQDLSKYHGQVIDQEPCDTCKGYMKEGVILISIKDGESEENPFRTGGWVVLKKDIELFKAPFMKSVADAKVGFVPDSIWDELGLPLTDYQKKILKK